MVNKGTRFEASETMAWAMDINKQSNNQEDDVSLSGLPDVGM